VSFIVRNYLKLKHSVKEYITLIKKNNFIIFLNCGITQELFCDEDFRNFTYLWETGWRTFHSPS